MTELTRDPLSLTKEVYDVLVIGGGIHGAAIAWDAALRGFKTVLVEKSDFGGAASAGCFKIVHGGLRYLQHFDIVRLRESVADQRILRIIAPHLVHPFPFMVPCYGWGMKSKPILKCGVTLYELLAGDRNRGVDQYHQLPKHKVLSKEECLSVAPGLEKRGLTGAVVFYDCQMSNCERLTFAVVRGAAAAGAKVFNYLQAVKFVQSQTDGGKETIDAVMVRDLLDNREFRVRAKVIVNAAGAWVDQVLKLVPPKGEERRELKVTSGFFSPGFQIVAKQFIKQMGVAVESKYRDEAAVLARGGRSYFVHPWRGFSLMGTFDGVFNGNPDDYAIHLKEIQQAMQEMKVAYHSERLLPVNVHYAFGGLRALDPSDEAKLAAGKQLDGEPKIRRKDLIVDHADLLPDRTLGNIENLLSVVGVKFTTFRWLAGQVVDRVSQKLLGRKIESKTSSTPVYGGEISDYLAFRSQQMDRHPELPQSVVRHLITNYGSKVSEIYDIMSESSEFTLPVTEGNDVLLAEVVHAARHEMVQRLTDIVLRRTGLGTTGYPGDAALRKTAEIAAAELGWDKARVESEIEQTKKVFNFF